MYKQLNRLIVMASSKYLPETFRQYLRLQVERGLYQNEAEVIQAALQSRVGSSRTHLVFPTIFT